MDYIDSEDQYNKKNYLRNTLLFIAFLLLLFFVFRNKIVRTVFDKKCLSIKNQYGVIIQVKKVGFKGIRTIKAEGLSVTPEGKDTLFTLTNAEVRLNLIDMFLLKINPLDIRLTNPRISLVGHKKNSNYAFILNHHHNKESQNQINSPESENKQSDYRNAIYRALKAVFGLTTAKYQVKNFILDYKDSTYATLISIPSFNSDASGFSALAEVRENGESNYIDLEGLTNKKQSSIHFSASMSLGKKPLPLLSHKFGLNISFDTLDVNITAKKLNREDIQLELNSSVKQLDLFSSKISDQTVKVKSGSVHFDISINSENYLVDSTSTIDLNGLKSNIFINYIPNDQRLLAFKISTGTFPSQQLFDALPEGIFTNLKGIKTSGTLNYNLDFRVKLDNPDSIYLNPVLKTKGFSISQYGYRNFSALNDTFNLDVYDEGQFIGTIHIGTDNHAFRTLDQISPLLINAIVTSEDGGFFTNNGFDIDGFKYAISEDIKAKKFLRGGSTITMQLVKNLYLNKNKNLFRKAEEYLIVWLIGSQGIVSKERMLEIYLNIIEWGPDVYGVNDACHYYFKKEPKDLTLDEAIYLASVIPRPKKFKYLFEKDGNLKSFMEGDFNFVANKLLQRGLITEEQFNSLKYNVKLSGIAKDLLFDTTAYNSDSLSTDEIRLDRDSTLLLP